MTDPLYLYLHLLAKIRPSQNQKKFYHLLFMCLCFYRCPLLHLPHLHLDESAKIFPDCHLFHQSLITVPRCALAMSNSPQPCSPQPQHSSRGSCTHTFTCRKSQRSSVASALAENYPSCPDRSGKWPRSASTCRGILSHTAISLCAIWIWPLRCDLRGWFRPHKYS